MKGGGGGGGKETKNRFRVLSGRDKGINYTGKWTCSDEIAYLWICKNVVYSYGKHMRELWPACYLGTNVLTNSSAFAILSGSVGEGIWFDLRPSRRGD